jgi:hypothetical protein
LIKIICYFFLFGHIKKRVRGKRDGKMTKQGRQNKDQTREQIEKQDKRNDVELGNEFQIGNTKSQSQKKSGRQVNKK